MNQSESGVKGLHTSPHSDSATLNVFVNWGDMRGLNHSFTLCYHRLEIRRAFFVHFISD